MKHYYAHQIYNDAQQSLVTVSTVEVQNNRILGQHLFYGNMEPVALIVFTHNSIHALNMTNTPIQIDGLIQNCPDLVSFIAANNQK